MVSIFAAWLPPISEPSGLVGEALRLWRELLEHLSDHLLKLLGVLFRIVGNSVTCNAAPDDLFCRVVKKVDDQRADFICFNRCHGSAAPSPMPAPAGITVVEGFQRFLLVRRGMRRNAEITTVGDHP